MSVSIPDNLRPFIEQQLENGTFANESALVTRALTLYRDLMQKHETLRADIQDALQEPSEPLDMEAIKSAVRDEFDERGQPR